MVVIIVIIVVVVFVFLCVCALVFMLVFVFVCSCVCVLVGLHGCAFELCIDVYLSKERHLGMNEQKNGTKKRVGLSNYLR